MIPGHSPGIEEEEETEEDYSQNGFTDVILTGSTDAMHARAWGDFKFWGRIRPYDGLIVIRREWVRDVLLSCSAGSQADPLINKKSLQPNGTDMGSGCIVVT